jgi:FixJ family two-component response regulator
VFALVVTGLLNREFGAALGIGEKTVRVHRARAWRRCMPDQSPSWSGWPTRPA